MKLADIAAYVTDRISSSEISLFEYVTTDSLLQNKRGRDIAQNLPPVPCSLTKYHKGDVFSIKHTTVFEEGMVSRY